MSVRPDGRWCAPEVGIMVSRQNGKGSVLEAIELWGLYINEETILHTAHNWKTALEGMGRLETLIRGCPELAAEVKRFSHNNNDPVIELRSGARVMFGTRTKGAARGLTIDRIICDEAMYYSDEQARAINPTRAAVPNAQLWLLGSAGTKESTQFGRMRARAIEGGDNSLFYAEWSIDAHTDFCAHDCQDHDDPYSEASWAKANPALGRRIEAEFYANESRGMSREGFQQEYLGVGDWPVDGDAWQVISKDSWMARVDESSHIAGQFMLAVDTTPDRAYSCIAAAGRNPAGVTHVEIVGDGEQYDHRPGVQWVVPTVLDMWRNLKPAGVVIDRTQQARSFIDELEAAGVTVIQPNSQEVAQGCGELYSAVIPRKGEKADLVHLGQPPLDSALAGAATRDLSGMWAWDKRASHIDICPLVAVTLARWGFMRHVHEKPAVAPFAFRGGKRLA